MIRRKMQYTASLLLFLLCFQRGDSAAIVEDQTGTWAAAGMEEYFARATDNIFPDELLEKVAKEAVIFQNHEAEERNRKTAGGGYMHGKGGTFWRPLFNKDTGEMTKPRFAIEVAIALLFQSDFANLKNKRVKGGEW